jgi:DNA-binding MarR family transcriptional regulator
MICPLCNNGRIDEEYIPKKIGKTTMKVWKAYESLNQRGTLRSIQKLTKISSASVVLYHLRRLELEGLIHREGK